MRYSRRRLAKAGTIAAIANVGSGGTKLVAGPAIVCTGRAASRERAVAVAVTALVTLLLSAAGVTGARALPVPLSADKRADRRRIRFKRLLRELQVRGHIGSDAAKV